MVLEFTSLPDLQQHSVTIPISVNVVPGDQAAGRIPDPRVQVEELLVDVDAAKKGVSTSLRDGDSGTARRTLGDAITSVSSKRDELKDSPGHRAHGPTRRGSGGAAAPGRRRPPPLGGVLEQVGDELLRSDQPRPQGQAAAACQPHGRH